MPSRDLGHLCPRTVRELEERAVEDLVLDELERMPLTNPGEERRAGTDDDGYDRDREFVVAVKVVLVSVA